MIDSRQRASRGSKTLLDQARRLGVFQSRVRGRGLTLTSVVRVVSGLFFIASAIPKITAHQAEINMFVQFGLPRSSLLVYLIAAIEIVFGLLVIIGLLTRPAAAILALDMVGAVLTAGVHVGGPLHLGLAPVLLAAMLYLLWAGPGAAAVDRRWREGLRTTPPDEP